MKENKTHVYSYSQLATFDECPFSFYLSKIEKVEQKPNAFAEAGTLIHDILDKWAKKELTKEQLPEEYARRYPDEVVTQYPRMLAAKGYTEKAYRMGLEYFENFDEFAGYTILSAEERFKIDLRLSDGTTRPFVGIIDMVLRDNITGELIICDHKSKSHSAFKKAENQMYRQPLLYASYVHEAYGEWPARMMFNLFKENGDKEERPFSIDAYNEAIEWATQRINKIESNDVLDWLECKDQDFFCENICGCRGDCPNGISKPYVKKTK